MKTFSHLWQYLAEFFLEWKTFQTNVVEKIKIHILRLLTFFRKSHPLWDNVGKYGGAREAADRNRGALYSGLVRLQMRKHTPASLHPHAHTNAQA
jgi:hypothetical protein